MAEAVNLIWIKDRAANLLAIAGLCLETPGHETDWETDISRPMRRSLSDGRDRALAQDTDKQDADKGQTEYMENCAGCHGADARGAGP
jgi:mono/diheme cytochrome c family protein